MLRDQVVSDPGEIMSVEPAHRAIKQVTELILKPAKSSGVMCDGGDCGIVS